MHRDFNSGVSLTRRVMGSHEKIKKKPDPIFNFVLICHHFSRRVNFSIRLSCFSFFHYFLNFLCMIYIFTSISVFISTSLPK